MKCRSFDSRFIFGSSDFTARTVRRHCPHSLHFIPYRPFTFLVRKASRPATRRMWVTTKGTLSTRVIRRKCFPCVMRPCTMVVHAANNCQQESSHFAGRDTHVERAVQRQTSQRCSCYLHVCAKITLRFDALKSEFDL